MKDTESSTMNVETSCYSTGSLIPLGILNVIYLFYIIEQEHASF